MDTVDILETARKMIADGDTAGARGFIAEHFKELPEDIQGEVLVALLTEAGSKNQFKNLALDVQKAAVETLDMFDEAEKEIKRSPDA